MKISNLVISTVILANSAFASAAEISRSEALVLKSYLVMKIASEKIEDMKNGRQDPEDLKVAMNSTGVITVSGIMGGGVATIAAAFLLSLKYSQSSAESEKTGEISLTSSMSLDTPMWTTTETGRYLIPDTYLSGASSAGVSSIAAGAAFADLIRSKDLNSDELLQFRSYQNSLKKYIRKDFTSIFFLLSISPADQERIVSAIADQHMMNVKEGHNLEINVVQIMASQGVDSVALKKLNELEDILSNAKNFDKASSEDQQAFLVQAEQFLTTLSQQGKLSPLDRKNINQLRLELKSYLLSSRN